jgi:riboflavin kinase / FMN adenylyltransferase
LARVQNKVYKAMLYIGSRPTLDDNLEKTIEVNLFDFDSDIYNYQIKIDFIDYLRDDVKFDSLEELKIQLKHDRLAAQNRLKTFDLNKII